ncbi:MAG: trypsin-like peptidase domain-containing protein [Bacteroidetes bacterium]|nr:trypsin-like peptidase domain-containing protein [Bacteroidota bacterium]
MSTYRYILTASALLIVLISFGQGRSEIFTVTGITNTINLDQIDPVARKPEVSGSGILLTGKGVVATNYHVIEDSKNISIKILRNDRIETYSVKVLITDKKNDLALLAIDDKKFLPIASVPYLAADQAERGESVFTIIIPIKGIKDINFEVTNGVISSILGISDDRRYYQTSISIQSRNSGCALFNSNGEIIGLTTPGLKQDAPGTKIQDINYAIKSNYLLLLAEKAGIKDQLPKQNQLANKEMQDQVKILKENVCQILVIR